MNENCLMQKKVTPRPSLAGKKEARNRNDLEEKLMTMTNNIVKENQDQRKNDVNMSRRTCHQLDVSYILLLITLLNVFAFLEKRFYEVDLNVDNFAA